MSVTIECSVCFSNPVNSILLPCGHVCVCWGCAQRLKGRREYCPLCRQHIDSVHRAYISGRDVNNTDGETKEDKIDRKFIIKNNIGLFPRIGTRGVGDEIVDLIRDIHQFNWVKNGVTGNFESTLSKATQGDIQHIKEILIEKRLTLLELNDDVDTKIYEIKEEEIDRQFIISGGGDNIFGLLRKVGQDIGNGWVREGQKFTSTLSRATDSDVRRIKEKLLALGLTLTVMKVSSNLIEYEITRHVPKK